RMDEGGGTPFAYGHPSWEEDTTSAQCRRTFPREEERGQSTSTSGNMPLAAPSSNVTLRMAAMRCAQSKVSMADLGSLAVLSWSGKEMAPRWGELRGQGADGLATCRGDDGAREGGGKRRRFSTD